MSEACGDKTGREIGDKGAEPRVTLFNNVLAFALASPASVLAAPSSEASLSPSPNLIHQSFPEESVLSVSDSVVESFSTC